MYLHIGNGKTVSSGEIILILDLDTAGTGRDNTALLKRLTAEGRVEDAAPGGLPKSLVLCAGKDEKGETALLSPLAASTLLKRLKPVRTTVK